MKTPWQVTISHKRINKKVLASCSYYQTNSTHKSKLKIYTTKLQLFQQKKQLGKSKLKNVFTMLKRIKTIHKLHTFFYQINYTHIKVKNTNFLITPSSQKFIVT